MLIDSRRVSAGSSRSSRDIGDTRNNGPNAPRSAIAGRKTTVEEDAILAKTVKERRRIQRIPPHRALVGAKGFADHDDYIGPRRRCAGTRLHGTLKGRRRQYPAGNSSTAVKSIVAGQQRQRGFDLRLVVHAVAKL